LEKLDCLADTLQTGLAAEHLERFKEWRRVLAPAHRYTNGLERLAGLDF